MLSSIDVDLVVADELADLRPRPAAKYCCVCSRRVPGGARTCSRICPASTCGKKSRPSSGNSSSGDDDQRDERDHRRRVPATASRRAYCDSSRGSARSRARSACESHQCIAGSRAPRRRMCRAVVERCDRAAHQIHEQHRHHREGEREAREQRADHRQRQRREQILGGALQQEHRHEHDADAQRRQEGRHRHLARARPRSPRRSGSRMRDVALDVLDHHGAVIDQDADRQRKAAQRHGIEGLAGQIDQQHAR